MRRVEQIASQMESEELPLEDLIKVYEEGLNLVRFCSERLEDAEKRLQAITRNAAGQPQGLADIQSPEEIPPSTPSENSATEEDSTSGGGPKDSVRLF